MSSFQIKLPNNINTKEENIINNKKDISQIKEKVYNTINNIKAYIYKNIENSLPKIVNDYFYQIINYFEIIINSLNYTINSKNENEKLQRKDEHTIRNLYGKLFHEKLINEILENKICVLTKKEKEYELLKQKTGVIFDNGKIICNDRKENEIIILRTENSLLKSTIRNNEDLLQEKNNIINNLKNDVLLYRTEIEDLRKIKNGEYSSFSNINININDPKSHYKNKIMNQNNKSFVNSLHFISSSFSKKRNKSSNKNKNCPNNIYSSYQINSKLINKTNNNSYKKSKKAEFLLKEKSNSKTKKKNNNDTIDINNNTYSIKYISVNKSTLFSPNKSFKIKKNINNNNKKQSKIKPKIINNNIPIREYNTINLDSHHIKESKSKKAPINKRFFINHRKANSIQIVENSLKHMSINSKNEKSLSNEKNNNSNNLFSVLRKISEIKSKNLNKNTPQSSLTNTITNNSKTHQQINGRNEGNSFHYMMASYADKKNNNKGRNEKNIKNNKITGDSIRDNSLSFMNKTTYDNYSNNDKNNFNVYYNSIEFYDMNQFSKK